MRLVTGQPYTEADVGEVAEAMYEDDEASTHGGWYKPWAEVDKSTYRTYRSRARAALGALAERPPPDGAGASPLYVVLHTDKNGGRATLGSNVYSSRTYAEHRRDERREMAARNGWPDHYEIAEVRPVSES